MNWTITKDFSFSASHHLVGLPAGHPCSRVHGHNYVVRVELSSGQLDATGFVADYSSLKPFGAWLDATVDHRHLNDVVPGQPSAENIAQHLAVKMTELIPLPPGVAVAVAVSETPKTWAWYRP